MDEVEIDNYRRNRTTALIGGACMLIAAIVLWLTAPDHGSGPHHDFMTARDDRLIWAKAFALGGLVAVALGLVSLQLDQRHRAGACRAASLGFWAVCLALIGAVFTFFAFRV